MEEEINPEEKINLEEKANLEEEINRIIEIKPEEAPAPDRDERCRNKAEEFLEKLKPEEREHIIMFWTLGEQNKRISRVVKRVAEMAADTWPCENFGGLVRILNVMMDRGLDNQVYVSDLVEDLRESPQSLSRTLRALEQEGLILRTTDPKDRRKTFVSITEAGLDIMKKRGWEMYRYQKQVFELVGYETLQHLLEEQEKIVKTMEELLK